MESNLCAVCGASWECEHRERREVIKETPDPYGPPVRTFSPLPSKAALEEAVLKIILEAPQPRRADRQYVVKELGFEEYMHSSASRSPIVRRISEAINELRKKRLIFGDYWYMPYSQDIHIQSLEQSIDSQIGWLTECEKEVERLRRKLAKTQEELNRIRED